MGHKLLLPLSKLKAYTTERYRRIRHAYGIFKMRFMPLALNTHTNLPEVFVFDADKAVNRGRKAPDGRYYSATYELEWTDLPDEIKEEIRRLDTVLRLYFGGDYLINTANVWRNIGIPDEYRALDIYSQVWHYDHVVDYSNVQLFILLSDTSEEHGPFEYLANASETEVDPNVQARNGIELVDAKIVKLTGIRGDGMLFSTGATPHRAGIPKFGNHRDIFSIAFFPTYTGIGANAKTLFQQNT